MAATRTYYPQLDFLRFVAVSLVIISHWLPHTHWLNRYTPNGMFGVIIFFVLSGYLITGLLLSARRSADEGRITRGRALGYFYARRVLRIFPVYYLCLAVIFFVVRDPVFRQYWPWHVFYASNYYFFLHPADFNGAHLWTLAVEEQFYLIWPWLIIFIPRRALPFVIGFFIAAALVFRPVMAAAHPQNFVYRLTPSVFDSFGIGALLAYRLRQHNTVKPTGRLLNILALISLAGCILFALTQPKNSEGMHHAAVLIFSNLFYSLISAWCIFRAVQGVQGLAGRIAEFQPFVYLGRISYSLYLFHWFLPAFLRTAGFDIPFDSAFNISLNLLILIFLSSLSWFLFEKPILGLKKYFRAG